MKTVAIIAAGGTGERLGVDGGKQLLMVAGKPVAAWAASAIAAAHDIDELVIVCDPERRGEYEAELRGALSTDKPLRFVSGGATRTASIAAGLAATSSDVDMILIHDGARPLVTPEVVDAVLTALTTAGPDVAGIVVGHPTSDTLKTTRAGSPPLIMGTPDRSVIWQVQTPQVFRAAALRDAYAQAAAQQLAATDDAGLLEAAGYTVMLFCGPRDNIKITMKEDIELVEALLRARAEQERNCGMRIGLGYDVHALVEGRKLILGGVDIVYERGLEGHSDADVLTHAVADAVIGALREGDLGEHFPDTDERYRGADSLGLLRRVADKARAQGWEIVDVDTVIIAQEPKLAPYREQMRLKLSAALDVAPDCVGVKATTTEHLGFEGRGEGIAAQAVALLERQTS
ncbi:MAG: 2-C-methyl-D-erythritol 2,4-cyclodiphosphate synthase [Coriobacteriia bacterium]|nr:2-C-methyl-D-erythritol 2,4-cyclodiphosphate synthase [Coriobacteriia bacterium]